MQLTTVLLLALPALTLAQSSSSSSSSAASAATTSAPSSASGTAGKCPDGRASITAGDPATTVCCPGVYINYTTNGSSLNGCVFGCGGATGTMTSAPASASACKATTVPLSASDYSQQVYGTLVPSASGGSGSGNGTNGGNGGSSGNGANGASGGSSSSRNAAGPVRTAAPVLVGAALAGMALF